MLVHEQLRNAGGVAGIELQTYLPSLVDNVLSAGGAGEKIDISMSVGEGDLSVKRAIPLGMIVAELVTNSVKHAFPNGRTGEISINLAPQGPSFVLVVSDRGLSTERPTPSDGDRLGLTIVETLTEQLDGEILFDWTDGVRATLTFPKD
jgi:two-component sensor histidine kinase